MQFDISFDGSASPDLGSLTASEQQMILDTANAAATIWSGFLTAANATLELALGIDNSLFSGNTLAEGGPAGFYATSAVFGSERVYDTNTAIELRTGQDRNAAAPDLHVGLTVNSVRNLLAFKTDDSAPVPSNRVDALSVFLHEIGHGLGFLSLDEDASAASVYDTFIQNGVFTGANAEAAAGTLAGVPLEPGSISHIAESGVFAADLMSPVMSRGTNTHISALDLAVLKDIGVPLRSDLGNPIQSIPNISIGNASVTEGGVLHFGVTLSAAASQNMTLGYDTFAGTASMADNDYLGGVGTLTIMAGQTTGTIDVQTVLDSRGEPDENMSVHLMSASFGSITQGIGAGTIINAIVPNISIDNATVTEGGVLQFGVLLNQATSQNITLGYDTFAGTASMADNDYLGGRGSLTIVAGQTTGTINIQTVLDSRGEPDETMSLHLVSASFGSITQGIGSGAIINAFVPNISIGNATVTEGGMLQFGVSLNQATSQNITLAYDTFFGTASMANNDYLGGAGTLTILAGQTTSAINIQTVQDSYIEPDETMSVHLISASFGTITQGIGTGTIINDDVVQNVPNISIGNASVTEGGVLHFGVALNQATSQNVTLSYDTFAGSASMADHDYLGGVGSLTILAGQTTGTISIQTVQDSKVEPDETMSVHLLTASLGNITQGTGNGTIINDDVAPIVPNISIGNATATEGGVLHFGVTLDQATSQNVTLSYDTFFGTASMADNDYLGGPGSLTILSGQMTGTIDIPTVQDSKAEPDETMSVHLLTASLGNISQSIGTGTIFSNFSRPEPSMTPIFGAHLNSFAISLVGMS